MLIDYQDFFTVRLSIKFCTKLSLNTPAYLKDVAEIPCETVMFRKSHKFQNTVLVL